MEDRVAYLEAQLAAQEAQQNRLPPQGTNASRATNDPLTEVVQFLNLGNFESPAYAGSKHGLSLARSLTDMVQATVWNKALPGHQDSNRHGSVLGAGSTSNITMDELRERSAGPPDASQGERMIKAFVTRLHCRYPCLDEAEIWQLHSEQEKLYSNDTEHLSKDARFALFKLFLVYAIGASLLQLTDKHASFDSERYYMTALRHVSAAREPRSLRNIQAMTLLCLYHLRNASSHALFYMVGLAMRTCIDLGLHRKSSGTGKSHENLYLRRRLFWTVYALERTVAISLGRPLSIADRQIDVSIKVTNSEATCVHTYQMLGLNAEDRGTDTEDNECTSITWSVAEMLFELRRIESRIYHSIYRVDKPLRVTQQKLSIFHHQLSTWRQSVLVHAANRDLNYLLLHYNRALRLLIQPFLSLLQPTDMYFQTCLRAAGDICQTHRRLHQSLEYGHSFIAVQTVFVAGITLLHCLWAHTAHLWSAVLANDIRACSSVLYVMSDRADWVKKYRDAFEMLVNATMEKVEQETQIAQKQPSATHHTSMLGQVGAHSAFAPDCNIMVGYQQGLEKESCTLPNGGHFAGNPVPSPLSDNQSRDNEALRLVDELADWIQQNQEDPVWMPEFEVLEGLSEFQYNL